MGLFMDPGSMDYPVWITTPYFVKLQAEKSLDERGKLSSHLSGNCLLKHQKNSGGFDGIRTHDPLRCWCNPLPTKL